MGCIVEFTESRQQIEFYGHGDKQKILIEILTKYSEMDTQHLADVLGVSTRKLKNVCNGKGFLVGEPADSLAQLFLIFFGQNFFQKFKLIRNFV